MALMAQVCTLIFSAHLLIFYQQLLFINSVSALSSPLLNPLRINNFVIRQVPRFKIPRGGNLAFFKQPNWDLIYYDKFGVFPHSSSSSSIVAKESATNQIQYLKYMSTLREIQTFLDKNEVQGLQPTETEKYSDQQGVTKLIPSSSSSDRLLNRAFKKNGMSQHQFGKWAPPDTDAGIKEKKGRESQFQTGADGERNFLADTDPTWYRIPRPVTEGLLLKRIQNNFHDYSSAGAFGGILSWSPALTMRGERSPDSRDRKFQTQGWK